MMTVNNKILCEAYAGGKTLKAEVSSGFATVQQKNNMVALKTLADATVRNGNELLKIPKGSTLFFSEETLYINQRYHTPIKNTVSEKAAVLADFNDVIGVELA